VLTPWLRRIGVVLFAAATILASGGAVAMAQGGSGGGGPFGSVQCGQSYSPSCTVTAGSGGSTQVTGATMPGPGGCAGTISKQFGCVPPGCTITIATVFCPLGFGGPAGPPAPGALAALAVRLLRIPAPVIRSSPSVNTLQLTRFPTWLWIDPAIWKPVSQTAAVPGERVTATATPVSVSWSMGDGTTVVCSGPGTPYSSRFSPASQSPDCGYTYQTSSAGKPNGAFPARVMITWNITYTATAGPGGTLPPLFTTAATAFRVAESQAINTTSGGR